MGRKKRFGVKRKQKIKRRKRLVKLRKKNAVMNEYYSNGHYIGPRSEK